MDILVLGLGQSLRGDDAAGLEAVRLWQERFPATARAVRAETAELPGLTLLDLLEGMDAAVLVDAVHAYPRSGRSSAAPGILIRLGPDELSSFTPDSGSAHGWGVAETLQLGRSLNPSLAACRITLIGIVGEQFDLGAGLSQSIQEALPRAVQMIEAEVHSLLKNTPSSP